MSRTPNQATAVNAPIASRFQFGHPWRRVIELMRVLLIVLMAVSIAGCATRRVDYTSDKSAVCEVHHSTMDKMVVPIYYGLMAFPPRSQDLYAASTNSFPHARDSINPSCVVSREREAVIYICPQCVSARRQWETDYDSRP